MYNGLTFLRGVAAFFIVGCHIGLAPRTVSGGGGDMVLRHERGFVRGD